MSLNNAEPFQILFGKRGLGIRLFRTFWSLLDPLKNQKNRIISLLEMEGFWTGKSEMDENVLKMVTFSCFSLKSVKSSASQ